VVSLTWGEERRLSVFKNTLLRLEWKELTGGWGNLHGVRVALCLLLVKYYCDKWQWDGWDIWCAWL